MNVQHVEMNTDLVEVEESWVTWPPTGTNGRRRPKKIASIIQEATEDFLYLYKNLNPILSPPIMEIKISHLLKFYRRNQRYINRLLVERVMKTELANICFMSQIENSDVVVELLRCINETFNQPKVNVLYFLIWYPLGNPRTLSAEVIEERKRNGKKIHCYVSYYLHHARLKRLTFGGHRMTDLFWEPLDYAVMRNGIMSNSLLSYAPQSVLALLQYGANFVGQVTNSEGRLPPLFFGELGRIIFGFQSAGLWEVRDLRPNVPASDVNETTKIMLQNFKIFVMSTRNPCVTTYQLAGTKFRTWQIPHIHILRPFYDTFFPGMEFGSNQPCSLQHSTRYVIRERLNANWQLPDGIKLLGLPANLRSYLNFENIIVLE